MKKEFKGRVVLAGNIIGEAVVSHQGLNLLATYKEAAKGGKDVFGGDQNNPDIYRKDLKGKIICCPQTIGSTTGGIVIQTVANSGLGPKALLFSNHIDSLAASGVVLTDVWVGQRIVTIDQLGEEFLNSVQSGQQIEIKEDGTVIVP